MHKNYGHMPRKNMSDVEKQVLMLKIEKLRLNRERAVLILNKGINVYFAFIVLAILGAINHIISNTTLNFTVIIGLVVLVISTIPYSVNMNREEKEISDLITEISGE